MSRYLLILLFVCLVSLSRAQNGGYSPSQIHISQWYTEDSMSVMWHTTNRTPTSYILYHRGKCRDEVKESNFKTLGAGVYQYPGYTGFVHMGVIEGLYMDETYCYQVGDTTYGYSSAREFRTPSASRAVIAALADTGTWGNVEEVLPALTMDTEPSLVLHAGDLSYAQNEETWDKWGAMVEPVASMRPMMIIPGNWDAKPFAIGGFLNRYSMPLAPFQQLSNKEWALPRPNRELPQYYYSFNHGPIHVVMLSSYDPYISGSEQYLWLDRDLSAASQRRGVQPWIIVCFHSPMYSSSTGHNGSDMKFRQAIEHLLKKHNVDLTLTGHDHGYERTFPVYNDVPVEFGTSRYENLDVPVHILAGTGGASADPWLPQPQWSAVRESTWGYTKIVASLTAPSSASMTSLHVTYLRANGTVGDEFTHFKDKVAVTIVSRVSPLMVLCLILVVAVVLPYCSYRGVPRMLFRGRAAQPGGGTPIWAHERGLKSVV